jgi:CelD/BcsL family acetyltransferase involved in cellulose biosynthesis
MEFDTRPIKDLTDEQRERWCSLVAASPEFHSPYFHPGYAAAIGRARDDVEVIIAREAGSTVGFVPEVMAEPLAMLSACGLSSLRFERLPAELAPPSLEVIGEATSPLIDLADGFDAYVAEQRARGGTIRSAQRKARKLAREVGPLRFVPHTAEAGVFEQLVAWKSGQRESTGTYNVLSEAWVLGVLDDLRTTELEGFRGQLSALYAGDDLVAVHMGIASRRVLHFWFPAYDPRHSRYSPGAVLLLELARHASSQGIRRIDLGPGDERYKSSFMNGELGLRTVTIGSSRAGRVLDRAIQRGKEWLRTSPLGQPVRAGKRAIRRMFPPTTVP